MLFFTFCSSVAIYFLNYFIFKNRLPQFHFASLSLGTKVFDYPFVITSVLFALICVFGVRIFSEYEFYSLGSNRIVFQRKLPLPGFICKFMWLFGIVAFFMFQDRYFVIQALEIKSLSREVMNYAQRPSIFQDVSKSTNFQKYENEDISAYLKKCKQGAHEISIQEGGIIKIRRYVFGTGRRENTAIEAAQSALNRMKGSLESLTFEVESEIVSEKELSAFTVLPKFSRYGQDRSVLYVQGISQIISSYDIRYVSIIAVEGQPEQKLHREITQHDQFIRHCLSLQAEIKFVTNFKGFNISEKELEQIITDSNDTALINEPVNFFKSHKKQGSLEYLNEMQPGFTKVSTYVLVSAKDEEICRRVTLDIENSLNTIYSGVHYGIKTFILEGRKLKRAYKRAGMKLSIENETKMNIFHLSPFTNLPEKPVRGIDSNYIPEFEIPLEVTDIVEGIEIGHVISRDKILQPLKVKIEDFRRNTTVIGLIGSGKTCLTKNIILELSSEFPLIDWIIFDYKSEYTQLLPLFPREILNDILIFAPGSEYAPLQINIFDPCGFSPEEHADRVFSLIREVYSTMFQQDIDLSVQMERVLKDVLDEYIADPTARLNGFKGFLKALDYYAIQYKNKFSYLEKTVTALHNRLNKFIRGVLKEIFDVSRSNISFDELIQKKVIIDLGFLQSQRVPKDDIRFLMNILVRLYGAYSIKRGLQHQLHNLIVVEECQFLVPELYRKQTSIDATPTEDLSIILRAYGVGFVFVGTRPLFAENSLANSYTIISFQLTKDAELLQKYMNLDERQVNYLKRIRPQECLIFSPTLKHPTRIRTNDFKSSSVDEEAIRSHNLLNYPNLYESMPSYSKEYVRRITNTVKSTTCAECTADEFVEPFECLCNKSSMECCKTTHKTAMGEGGDV